MPDETSGFSIPDTIPGCERVFRRNGLPTLVDGRTVRRDVFGRAAPFLLVVLLLQLLGAVNKSWPGWANIVAIVGGLIVVVGGYVLLNGLRGRPWATLPQSVDVPELGFFVLVPALLPLLFGGQWQVALVTVGGNVVLLLVTWFMVQYGLLSTLWWGVARTVDELADSLLRLLRTLPMLLVFSLVLFYNAEVWLVFDRAPSLANFVFGGLFALLILAFVALRLPSETRSALRTAAEDIPGADEPPLTRGQRANVVLMLAASQLLQVLVVCTGVFFFFVAVGVGTVTPEVQRVWAVEGGWSWPIVLDGTQLVLNQSLLRVSAAIATFTGLYYAITVQTDAGYRAEFVEGIGRQLRSVLTVRVQYHALLSADANATSADS